MAAERSTAALDFYFDDVRRYPLLAPDEEQELARAARAGDTSARERLVASNLRFVIRVAKRYQGLGLPLEDLVCEGNRGMIRAAETFDPERGTRFITYAVNWIRARIDLALARASTVRRPLAREREARRVRRLAARLSQQFGSRPTPHDIAHALSMDEAAVAAALSTLYAYSIEEPTPGSEGSLSAQLPAADPQPDEVAAESERQQLVSAVLATLPEREATVIRLWYGFTGPPLTQQQIADRLGLTRQRIQQIADRAMKRLREPRRANRLRGLFDVPPEAKPGAPRDRATDRGGDTVSRPSRRRGPPVSSEVEALRCFFREEAERTSLRGTARAAGLKRAGLAKFVAGETFQPNPETLSRMRAYHAARSSCAGSVSSALPPDGLDTGNTAIAGTLPSPTATTDR